MSTKSSKYIYGKNNKKYYFNFKAEETSSDSGLILFEKLEKKYNLIRKLSKYLNDKRQPSKIDHEYEKMITQRVFLNAAGYGDCNVSDDLKNDEVIETIIGKLSSQPTLSRLETKRTTKEIVNLHKFFLESYIERKKRHKKKVKKIIIDIDSTEVKAHGKQQRSLFHGYYGNNIYHPLVLIDGINGDLISPILRRGNAHSNLWAGSILNRVIKILKKRFNDIEIIIRGDCGYSTPKIYNICNKYNIKYCIGVPSNNILKKKVKKLKEKVKNKYKKTGKKLQKFIKFNYKANSWEKKQKLIAKVEHTGRGLNVRYITTNLKFTPKKAYKNFYVQRAEKCENKIKELKKMANMEKLSCEKYLANQFRMFIYGITYIYFNLLKKYLKGTKLENSYISTIINKLIKIGGYIREKGNRIYFQMSKSYPYKKLFNKLANSI